MATSKINVPTVLASAGIAAVISSLVVAIAAVGFLLDGNGSPTVSAAQPTVVNLGAAAQTQAAGAQAAQPGQAAAPTQAPAAGQTAAAAPAEPAAPAPAAPAAPAGTAPAAQQTQQAAPQTTQQAVDAAPQNVAPSIRGAKTDYLVIRSEKPSPRTLEWQYAAFWNPRLPMEPKLAVTYKGDTPKVRKVMTQVMQSSQIYDFFSAQGAALPPVQVDGNHMSVVYRGSMAGFPVQSVRYHWIREDGIWKYDWKRICAAIACNGNPDFGY